ncbi:MAG: DUF2007 domain-containing protein [Chloroflexi bacterium]|nr:DUF2007 domain-containing protein [Chloroflexota bacterium]
MVQGNIWGGLWAKKEQQPAAEDPAIGSKEIAGGEVPWVVVYVAAGQLEAHVVKGHLESEDIPVLLKYESAGLVYGLAVGPMAEVKILVPEPLADHARTILGENRGE